MGSCRCSPGLALCAAVWLSTALGDQQANFELGKKCPEYTSIQSEAVKTSFDYHKMAGTFYELAMHDYTQFPTCVVGPACVRSVKKVDGLRIHDNFTLGCFGGAYSNALEFRIVPEKRGYLEGKWEVISGDKVIPDTVVDFKESLDPENDSQYEWVIEVQCAEADSFGEFFVGVNFYAKHATAENLAEMTASAERNGVGPMMYTKPFGLRKVHQGADCWYHNETHASSLVPQQSAGAWLVA